MTGVTIYKLSARPWDRPYIISISEEKGEFERLKKGDKVILRSRAGVDLVEVIDIEKRDEASQMADKSEEIVILRKANEDDIRKESYLNQEKNIKRAVAICRKLAKERKLPMKVMDAYFSFDGGRVIFLFTAPDRIDFRQLVKDLSQTFHKSIRMHQIGIRQIFGLGGDIGPCGCTLCCKSFLGGIGLGKVTTDLIADQDLSHRGIDRLTGVCGRLKCCLLFEEEIYREKIKNRKPKDKTTNQNSEPQSENQENKK